MKHLKKIISLLLIISITTSLFSNVAYANELQVTEPLKPTSQSMIQSLNQASIMLSEGTITEEEYIQRVLEIYQLDSLPSTRSGNYYPEVQTGYITHKGVEYLYEEGFDNINGIMALLNLLAGMGSSFGWGLAAVSVIVEFGGTSYFEEAVNKAYFTGKGIAVYYKIHKSVQSMNKVRYEVA